MPVIIIAIVQFIAMVVLRVVIGVTAYFTAMTATPAIMEKFPRANYQVVGFGVSVTVAAILTVIATPLFAIIASMC